MTESEWLLLENARDFYGGLFVVAQPRKLVLLAATFYRRVWDLLPNERVRLAVEATEQYADGRTTARDLLECWTQAEVATGEGRWIDDCYCCPECERLSNEQFATSIHPAIV